MKTPKFHDGHKAMLAIFLIVLLTCILGTLPAAAQAATWDVHTSVDTFTDKEEVFATAFTENDDVLTLTCVTVNDKTGKREPALLEVSGWQPMTPTTRRFRVDKNMYHSVYVQRDGVAAVAQLYMYKRLVRELIAGEVLKFEKLAVHGRKTKEDQVNLDGFGVAYRAVKSHCN